MIAKKKMLIIREFPTGKLSTDMLEKDLDELELVEKFKLDMVLLDYGPPNVKYRQYRACELLYYQYYYNWSA